jgi:hypothetical protein
MELIQNPLSLKTSMFYHRHKKCVTNPVHTQHTCLESRDFSCVLFLSTNHLHLFKDLYDGLICITDFSFRSCMSSESLWCISSQSGDRILGPAAAEQVCDAKEERNSMKCVSLSLPLYAGYLLSPPLALKPDQFLTHVGILRRMERYPITLNVVRNNFLFRPWHGCSVRG